MRASTLALALAFTLSLLAGQRAAGQDATQLRAVRESGVASGAVAIIGATDPSLAEALTAGGAMAVDLLAAVDDAKAQQWLTKLSARGRGGFVSVVPMSSFASLPYPDRFLNLIVVDADALGAAAPSEKELRRVAAPYGAVCAKRGGKWNMETIPLAADLDEWTHFEHGPDSNPTSRDRVVGHVRGLQWASYDIQTGPGSTPRIGGGVHVRAVKSGEQHSALLAREAGNGLLRWRIAEAPGIVRKRSEVFEKSWCIADGRIHGLVGDVGEWAQCVDLLTGKTVRVYDQGIPAPPLPDGKTLSRLADEERRWKSDVTHTGDTNTRGPYSLGLMHIALDGRIIQGGNAPAPQRQPGEFNLGPTRLRPDRRAKDEPDGPDTVTQTLPLTGLVVALDANTGKRLWSWEAPADLRVAEILGGEGAVAVGLTPTTMSLGVHYKNRFTRMAEVVVLDAKTGQLRWRSDKVKDFLLHHMVIADGALYVGDHHVYMHEGDLRRLVRFNLASGKIEFDATPTIDNKPDNWKNRFAILDGRIFLGGHRDLVDFDAKTGGDVKTTKTSLPGYGTKVPGLALGHCSTWRATPNGWLSGRFARFIPFDGAMENRAAVSRNWCDEGHYPAYGMTFSGYHPGCFCSTYLLGHVAMHSRKPEPPLPDEQRLTRGPAWGAPLGKEEAPDQWPTFRANAQRGNYVDARLGSTLTLLGADPVSADWPAGPLATDWAGSVLPRLSAPVVVDGLALVSIVHERRLAAIDVATGKERWSRSLPGRSVYPPTVHRGLAYLGGQDGTVSCLRLSDGELVWRFLAAPTRQRTAVASQMESVWPVPGVVVHGGRIYAVAGSHNQLDGGLFAYALDPATGAILGRTVITSGFSNLPPFNKAPAEDLEGRSNDIPSVDRLGRALHVRDIAIDVKSWDWLNLCAFLDSKLQGHAGFARNELAALFTRPLENHNAFYRPVFLRYGGAGLGIKFNMSSLAWIALSHDVEAGDMAIAPDRIVTTAGGRLGAYALDARGLPANTPRPNSTYARDLTPPTVLSKDYRSRTAVALTKDRVVVTLPATQGKPALLVLLDGTGAELTSAKLPADPLPANLAIAGEHIVLGTADGRVHRFATRP